MKAAALAVALVTALLAVGPSAAQMTVEQAREEGKAMANEKRSDSSLVPTDNAQAEAVPAIVGPLCPRGPISTIPISWKLPPLRQNRATSNIR